jgi:glycosyltransferase involved in cell wall biosynthesis
VKVLTYVTHPVQYQTPLFAALEDSGVVDLEICYYTGYDGQGSRDPGFGREVVWDIPLRPSNSRQFHAWGERGAPETARTFSPGAVIHAVRSRPDVVLLHQGFHAGDLAVLAACRARRIPVVCRPETLSERPRGTRGFVARSWLVRSLNAVCAIGSRAHGRLVEAGMSEARITLSPYTVDVERFKLVRRVSRHDARARIGVPEGLPVILFAGKLTDRKRPLDLVRAMGRLDAPARLVIAGAGELHDRVLAEVSQARIPIIDLGFVNQSQIPYVYRAADVLAMPSSWEPWGLAVNEAMACGTPAVCSTGVAAGDDLVQPLSDQLVHPTGDEEALAAALRFALSDNQGGLECAAVERIDRWTYREAVAGLLEAFDVAVGRVAAPAAS